MRPDFDDLAYDPPTAADRPADPDSWAAPEGIDITAVYGPDALNDLDHLDVQDEYDGGWSNDNA